MRTRASLGRVLGIFVPIVVGGFGAACSDNFDTSRTLPPRGTLGAELFGVVCDRAGGQALHEDLSGASYAGICHAQADGTFSSKVDVTQLPPIVDGQLNADGQPVPMARSCRGLSISSIAPSTWTRRPGERAGTSCSRPSASRPWSTATASTPCRTRHSSSPSTPPSWRARHAPGALCARSQPSAPSPWGWRRPSSSRSTRSSSATRATSRPRRRSSRRTSSGF